MITRYTYKNLIWVDLEAPTQEEVRGVMEEFRIDPLVAEELIAPTLKPKVDLYEDYIYLILHFPASRHTHSIAANQEVDFVIGRDFLITTRYDTIDPMHKFSKVFEVHSILDRNDIGTHAGYLFFYMIKKLYKSVEHELEFISDSLVEIESFIFNNKEQEMVFQISNVSRELLNFNQALTAHKEVLESFEKAGKQFFGSGFGYHLRSIIGDYYKIHNEIQFHNTSVSELRETNNSLLTTKQNETMRVLTIMAFITFPLTLLSSLLGMNAQGNPIVHSPYSFWIIIGILIVVALSFLLFFKYKKWL